MRQEPLTWRQRGQLWLRLGLRLGLSVLAVLLALRLLPPLLGLFAPFVCALVLAALLNSPVRWLQRRLGWSRRLLSLLTLLLLFGLLGGVLTLLVYAAGSELLSLTQNWEGLLEQLRSVAGQLEGMLWQLQSLVPEPVTQSALAIGDRLMLWLQGTASELLARAADYLGSKAVGLPAFFLALVMFLMASYFLTADYPYLRTRAIQHMDEGVLSFLGQVRSAALVAFGGYLRAQLLLSAGVFFILLGGFLLTGQGYALLLALVLAVMDFIPIIGSGTVMVPWAVIALFTRDYSTAVSVMVIWGAVALFRQLAEPKFVGNQTGLSPILSLVSIYTGMRLAGVAGMILGPILTLVVLNLAGLGLFHGIRMDLAAAAADIAAILRQRP
ncbi:MAG: sporulation integral membrane protein YtvI [Lawsonibacter sp.]|nr:sporulation integral membrane protein YtvI [Lawsonibacter sp.]